MERKGGKRAPPSLPPRRRNGGSADTRGTANYAGRSTLQTAQKPRLRLQKAVSPPRASAKAMQKPRFHAETRLHDTNFQRRSFAADGLPFIQNALSKKLYSARCQLPMEW